MSLSNDLVPFISDPTASLILATIASAHWASVPSDPNTEEGTIQFRVTELLSSSGPKPGELLRITGHRYGDPEKRQHMGFDSWNVLPFETGKAFVLAVRKASHGGEWIAVAADFIAPGNDALVPALRRALVIEKVEDPAARRLQLEQALTSSQVLLFRYALDAIGRRARVPRTDAAQLLVEALGSQGLPKNAKLSLVQQLTRDPIYDEELGADPVNRQVIGAVSGVLAAETDAEWSLIWTQFLTASLLPAFSSDAKKDQEIRQTLIRAVGEPARRQVPGAFAKAAERSPRDPRIPKLLEIWQAALR